MKGYLKSNDGIFQLAPKVTTVGREGCDLVIQVSEIKNTIISIKIILISINYVFIDIIGCSINNDKTILLLLQYCSQQGWTTSMQ